jgi:hypothetical protein
MKQFDANQANGALHCLACERALVDEAWFARIKLGKRRAVFCRPRCVEVFLDEPEKFARRLER